MEDFVATIKWRCNGGDFLNNKYSRAHTWEFDGGAVVPASATYAPGAAPSPELEDSLHHQAHEQCFIANSVTAEIAIEIQR